MSKRKTDWGKVGAIATIAGVAVAVLTAAFFSAPRQETNSPRTTINAGEGAAVTAINAAEGATVIVGDNNTVISQPPSESALTAPTYIHPDKPNAEYNAAMLAYDAGDYPSAATHFKEAIELSEQLQISPLDKDTAIYHNSLGLCYEKMGEHDEAAKQFEAAMPAFYNDEEHADTLTTLYFNRGVSNIGKAEQYNSTEYYNAAIDDFTTTLKRDPSHVGALNNRGVCYKAIGEPDKSKADFDEAIKQNPDDATAYCNEGVFYGDAEDYDEAIPWFDKAIERDPGFTIAYFNRGTSYGRKAEREKDSEGFVQAIKDLDKAIELDKLYTDVYSNRGNCYRYLGKLNEAIADYTEAIKLDPGQWLPYNNRGICYGLKGRYKESIDDLTTAIRLDPRYTNAYINRGVSHRNNGENLHAIADFYKASKLDPNDAQAKAGLASAINRILKRR